MSDILASVSVVLGGEISGFKAAMADAKKELRGLMQFSEGLKDIGSSLTSYVSAPLALLGTAAVAASGKMEALSKGLNAISQQDVAKSGVTGLDAIRQASDQTAARLAVLTEISKAPGIGLEQAIQGDIRLRAVGISAADSAKDLKEFANAIATTGGTAADLDRVTVQLAQLSAKGKVLSQDLRPIIEAAPSVSQALLKMFGTIDSEAISGKLQKLGQNSSDFINQLTTELAKAPRVLGGFNNNLQNALNSATQSAAKFGDAIIKTFNLNGVLDGLSTGLTRLGDGFAALSPGVQRTIILLAGAAAAVGPLLVAVGTLGAALPAITAGFKVLGVSSLEALTPILPIAAAVAAAAYLIYENWDSITAYFTTGAGATLFSNLADAASSATDRIGQAFNTLRANTDGNLGQMGAASRVFSELTRELFAGLTGILDTFSGTVGFITAALTGDFQGALEGIGQTAKGLLGPLRSLFFGTDEVAQQNPVLILSKSATEFNAAFPALQANINALNALRLGPLVSGETGGIAVQLGLLEKLKAELKDVQAQRDKETSVAGITADNARIESLQKQIKALEETGKASSDMAKAYAEVQKSFRTIGNESQALGDQFNYLQARQAADQAGIKKLLDAGYSPFSTKVKELVGDLKNLNVTLGDNALLSSRKFEGQDNLFKTPDFKLELPKLDALPTSVLPDYKAIFGNAAKDIADGNGALENAFTPVKQSQLAFNTNMEQLTDQLGASIGPQLASIAGLFGDAFGSIIAGTASASDAFGQLFGGILSSIGSFMSDFGKQLVTIGIGKLALDTLFDGPQGGPLAIAAGIGLIALAGVVSAVGQSASSNLKSVGSGGGVSTSAASTPRTYTPAAQAAPPAAVTIKHEVVMVQRGSDLRGVLQIATTRTGRVVGSGG